MVIVSFLSILIYHKLKRRLKLSPPTASADSLVRLVDKKATEEGFFIDI